MGASRQLAVALPAAVLAVFLAACSGTHYAVPSATRVVDVTERDFSVRVSSSRISPGPVVFHVTNHGPDAHELIVVRTGAPQLPLRSDGITVSEERLASSKVGGLEPGQPGAVRDLRLDLKKGRYVLFCNMSGHFMGGMRAVVVVR